MSENQKKKTKFRASRKWKDFRHKMNVKQKGLDPITNSKLRKGANLHHCDLNEDHYEDLSNEDNFIFVNHNTHQWIHEIYRYFVKDEEIIERLKNVLIKMKEINEC